MLLHEMAWPEAQEYFAENDVAILPVGSNEQHGPHCPLGSDHLIAKAIAEETARRTGVMCLQVVPFGVSSHHRQFWGTIWISPEVFENYVREVCLALSYYGVKKILIVNGHGGNRCALIELARTLRVKGIFVSVFQWWEASRGLLPELFRVEERGHAGSEETSVNLALHPQIMDMDAAVDEQPRRHSVLVDGVSLPVDTVDSISSGVFGVSTSASAERGRRVFESVVEELVRHVEILRKTAVRDLAERSKV